MLKISLIIIGSAFLFSSCRTTTKTETVAAISAADEKTLLEKEISHWEYAKLKNLGTLRNTLANDYAGYFGTNILNADATVDVFKNADVRSYRLSHIKVKPVTDNVAIVYYMLDRDIVDTDGNPWADKVAAAETYVKTGKEWKAVFYQETRME